MNFSHITWDWKFGDFNFAVDPLSLIPEGYDGSGAAFWTVVVGMTEADATQVSDNHKWTEVRRLRNLKISETDWWGSTDLTMTDERAAYRQALRDITNTYSSPDGVVWPDQPA